MKNTPNLYTGAANWAALMCSVLLYMPSVAFGQSSPPTSVSRPQGGENRPRALVTKDELTRRVTNVGLNLDAGQADISSAGNCVKRKLCPLADKMTARAYAYIDLANLQEEGLLSQIPNLDSSWWLETRMKRFREKALALKKNINGSEIDLEVLRLDLFKNCDDHPLTDKYLGNRAENKRNENVLKDTIAGLGGTPHSDTSTVEPGPVDPKPIHELLVNCIEKKDPKACEELCKRLPASVNCDEFKTAVETHNCDKLKEMLDKDPSNGLLNQAWAECVQYSKKIGDPSVGPVATLLKKCIEEKDPKACDEVCKRLPPGINCEEFKSALETHNCDAIKVWLEKNPANAILIQAMADCLRVKSGPGLVPTPGPIPIVDPKSGGEILGAKKLDATHYVVPSTSKSGILTRERRLEVENSVQNGTAAAVVKHEETVEWQFAIEKNDSGFELTDSSGKPSTWKGFEVTKWTVTGPDGQAKALDGSGSSVAYKMDSDGRYKVEAEVKTKLDTTFKIYLDIENVK